MHQESGQTQTYSIICRLCNSRQKSTHAYDKVNQPMTQLSLSCPHWKLVHLYAWEIVENTKQNILCCWRQVMVPAGDDAEAISFFSNTTLAVTRTQTWCNATCTHLRISWSSVCSWPPFILMFMWVQLDSILRTFWAPAWWWYGGGGGGGGGGVFLVNVSRWDCRRDKIAHKLTQRLYKSVSRLVLGDCKPVGRIKTQTAFGCLSLLHVFGAHRNWQKWSKPHFFHFHLIVCNRNTSCKTHQGSMDIFVQQSGDIYSCSHAVS